MAFEVALQVKCQVVSKVFCVEFEGSPSLQEEAMPRRGWGHAMHGWQESKQAGGQLCAPHLARSSHSRRCARPHATQHQARTVPLPPPPNRLTPNPTASPQLDGRRRAGRQQR